MEKKTISDDIGARKLSKASTHVDEPNPVARFDRIDSVDPTTTFPRKLSHSPRSVRPSPSTASMLQTPTQDLPSDDEGTRGENQAIIDLFDQYSPIQTRKRVQEVSQGVREALIDSGAERQGLGETLAWRLRDVHTTWRADEEGLLSNGQVDTVCERMKRHIIAMSSKSSWTDQERKYIEQLRETLNRVFITYQDSLKRYDEHVWDVPSSGEQIEFDVVGRGRKQAAKNQSAFRGAAETVWTNDPFSAYMKRPHEEDIPVRQVECFVRQTDENGDESLVAPTFPAMYRALTGLIDNTISKSLYPAWVKAHTAYASAVESKWTKRIPRPNLNRSKTEGDRTLTHKSSMASIGSQRTAVESDENGRLGRSRFASRFLATHRSFSRLRTLARTSSQPPISQLPMPDLEDLRAQLMTTGEFKHGLYKPDESYISRDFFPLDTGHGERAMAYLEQDHGGSSGHEVAEEQREAQVTEKGTSQVQSSSSSSRSVGASSVSKHQNSPNTLASDGVCSGVSSKRIWRIPTSVQKDLVISENELIRALDQCSVLYRSMQRHIDEACRKSDQVTASGQGRRDGSVGLGIEFFTSALDD